MVYEVKSLLSAFSVHIIFELFFVLYNDDALNAVSLATASLIRTLYYFNTRIAVRRAHTCAKGTDRTIFLFDLQTYASCAATDQQTAERRLLSCIADIHTWMSSNRLKLNADKTEFIWLGTRQQLSKVVAAPLQVRDCYSRQIQFVTSAFLLTVS